MLITVDESTSHLVWYDVKEFINGLTTLKNIKILFSGHYVGSGHQRLSADLPNIPHHYLRAINLDEAGVFCLPSKSGSYFPNFTAINVTF